MPWRPRRWLAYRADGTRVSAPLGGAGPAACVALAWYGADAKGERRHMQFYFENLYVSSFYASWGETLEALWRGALLEAAPRAAAAGPASPFRHRATPAPSRRTSS